MDKIDRYREVIINLLTEHPDVIYENDVDGTVETHIIFDDKHQRYMLYRSGWSDNERIHAPIIYIRLYNDKVWVEEDWTEDGITPDLLDAGIPKEDIVLGFRHHPTLRHLTEFPIA